MKTKATELFEGIMQNLTNNGLNQNESMFAYRYIKEYKESLDSSWTSKYNNVFLSATRQEVIQKKLYELSGQLVK